MDLYLSMMKQISKATPMNGIQQILVLIAKDKCSLLTVFRVYLNLNGLSGSTVDDIPETIVILHRSDTEKAIG
jgi:hypothetical protein